MDLNCDFLSSSDLLLSSKKDVTFVRINLTQLRDKHGEKLVIGVFDGHGEHGHDISRAISDRFRLNPSLETIIEPKMSCHLALQSRDQASRVQVESREEIFDSKKPSSDPTC